jgi:hypothetical protein
MLNRKIITPLLAVAFAVSLYIGNHYRNKSLVADNKAKEAAEMEKQDKEIIQYSIFTMEIVKAKLSPTNQEITANAIARVSSRVFGSNLEQKRAFVTLVAIESRFNRKAKSPVGATGLTQVMPQYSKEFADKCGMSAPDPGDLEDTEINLSIGACQFKSLIEASDGNIAAALVAYNAGYHSEQLKQLKSMSNIQNIETSNYVTRFYYVQERVNSIVVDTYTSSD